MRGKRSKFGNRTSYVRSRSGLRFAGLKEGFLSSKLINSFTQSTTSDHARAPRAGPSAGHRQHKGCPRPAGEATQGMGDGGAPAGRLREEVAFPMEQREGCECARERS